MKFLAMLLPVSLLWAHPLSAQAPLPQPAPTLSPTANNTWNLAWTGILDRTYFLQCSPDLEQWIYLPNYIETGTGQAINYGLSSPNQQAFFRLAFSDITTLDADTADFDGDGIGNLLEINAGTDPLDLDTDDDGLTNAEEAALGTSMTNPDSDGDGITDGGEVEEGTDPNDANDTPDAEWLTVTGDLAAGEVAARNRSLTIPAGESRLVVVAIASDEYPIFTSGTEENFEYNDVLTWEVKLDGDEVLSNRIDVNARNTQWDEALANGQTLRGFDPVHFEAVKLIAAPADTDGQVEIELSAMNIEDGTRPSTVVVGLLPVELGPDKLAVNGDFNEGDTATISSQLTGANADNRNQTLIAKRDSIDGDIKAGEIVTRDLHEGWFGLSPDSISDDFFDDATITITKLNKTDPETGEREEGQVRFFATWGENQELLIEHDDPFIDSLFPGGVAPRNLVGKVYGSNRTIPSGAKFWIEGVSLGNITLEWRLQKGDIDVKHEQTFEVGNDWSREKWQKSVRDEIYLDSFTNSSGSAMNGSSTQGVNVDQYVVANDFLPNRPYIHSVYEYYAKLHREEPEKFLWAGLAKQAGAPVYAGLSDAQNGRAGIAIATFGIIDNQTLKTIQDILIDANINIYNDLAYQFVAYRTGGIDSIEYLFEEGIIDFNGRTAWRKIDEGSDISGGNQDLLRREQFEILRATYLDLNAIADGKVSWLFSVLAKNPVPLGPFFRDVVPDGNIAIFDDRWQWITNSGNGIWPLWIGEGQGQRLQFSGRVLTNYAGTFNLVAPLR